ncbi:DUF4304 domain-containing protein [Ruegeria arenilitoris]|uniref:DUF4304 domain-containing protein n=1 Tax=Ruegeria arenilitoris TaxID=1173585 RepID=UPI001479941D
MSLRSLVQKEFDKIVFQDLAGLGFNKVSTRLTSRPIGEFLALVGLQFSHHSSAGECDFTVDCGLMLPGVWELYSGQTGDVHQLSECVCFGRLGFFFDQRMDIWWSFRSNDDLKSLHQKLADMRLVRQVRFSSARSVRRTQSRPAQTKSYSRNSSSAHLFQRQPKAVWDNFGGKHSIARKDICNRSRTWI